MICLLAHLIHHNSICDLEGSCRLHTSILNLEYNVLTIAGQSAHALATSSPWHLLVASSRCLPQNRLSQPLPCTLDLFHGVDLAWIARTTFRHSSLGVSGCPRSCILKIYCTNFFSSTLLNVGFVLLYLHVVFP